MIVCTMCIYLYFHSLSKVAGILTRNDGECHLERDPNERFYDYSRTPEQVFVHVV